MHRFAAFRYLALLIVLAFTLTGCTALDEMSRSDALPDLRLLSRPVYQEQPPAAQDDPSGDVLRVDLWLDASQVMGGMNPSEESIYPHSSRKYREGGFHYRYENTVGMYESVLRCMLASAEGSRVRLLRYGNERLPDDYLLEMGFSAETLRSVRRDLLTYAIDPMPSVFTGFSGADMTNSFYALGTPQLNQMDDLNASLLENPSLAGRMNQVLDAQIHAIANDTDERLLAVGSDSDYPLLYALDNLDLSRLSVITCDPAAIRRLTAVDASGTPEALVEELLSKRGVFDAGLSVGLYAFTLDYMGQMPSFAAADFSEPLLWGRLDYSNYTRQTEGLLPMPRTLLTLVIGQSEQVDAFTSAFAGQLADAEALRELRGPSAGQLTYTQNGQTVVQEPFSFAYEYTAVTRTQPECLTQYTEGASLSAEDADISLEGSLHTVTLEPVNGVQPDRTLTLALPLDSQTFDFSRLGDVTVSVETALLLSDTLPNHPSTVIPEAAQAITLRDSIYLFTPQQPESPVQVSRVDADASTLTLQLAVDGSALVPGYYRLLVTADLPGGSVRRETPAWVRELSTTVTNEQISAWESFTQVLTRFERKRETPSRPFQHAWGDASNTSYYGADVPDFPPVMLAPGLSELVEQMQHAADPGQVPCICFVFDLFVANQPM